MTRVEVALLSMVGLFGCSTSPPSDTSVPASPKPVVVTIDAEDGHFEGTTAATLVASFAAEAALYEITLGGVRSDEGGLSSRELIGSFSADQVKAKHGVLTVNTLSLNAGQAQISGRASAGDAGKISAQSGTVEMVLQTGHVRGTISNAQPAYFDGTFDGTLLIQCWVPKSLMGAPQVEGGTAGGTSEPLVLDERFETSLCAPLATLAQPAQ